MKVTAPDLRELGVVDEIIEEPLGGAHTDREEMARRVGDAIERTLRQLGRKSVDQLLDDRYKRFRNLGVHVEG